MDPYTPDTPESNEQQGLHALMRFLRVVRRHQSIVIGMLIAAVLLGTVYYKRKPKEFESSAKLMIRKLASDPEKDNGRPDNGLLSSYRQLLLSDRVLNDTIEGLTELPPELESSAEKSLWPETLRSSLLKVSFSENENVLIITSRSKDPESTVNVIRSLVSASQEFMSEFQKNDASDTAERLESQLTSVKKQMADRNEQLLEERKNSGDIVINEGARDSHPLLQRVSQLNDELTTVRNKRIELSSMLASVVRQVQENEDLTLALRRLESIAGEKKMSNLPVDVVAKPERIQKLQDELRQQKSELEALRGHFGSRHAEIVRREAHVHNQELQIESEQQDLRRQVGVGIRDPQIGQWLITTIRSELTSVSQYEGALQQEYDVAERSAQTLSDRLAFIHMAEKEVETLREVHSALLKRLSSIDAGPTGGLFKVAVLTEPLVPQSHVYPVLPKILAAFCAVSFAIAMSIIYVIDLLDDRLRSPEEVREELGLPVLGVVRRLPEHELSQCKIYVHKFSQTPHAECFRTLKTSLTLTTGDTKCIAITSSEASEGKTTTTVNLAASYAQTGLRTLLIDADMRRPGLSRLLEVRGMGGLSEVLRAESGIQEMCEERVIATEVPLLDILPCGPRILNAGMLLSMPSLSIVLDWAISKYDQVIVDCPPTLPVSDAAIVGRLVDGLLFLMNPDKTHRRSVVRAVDQLKSMGLRVLGIVANTSLGEQEGKYGYQYGYGYGYASDYSYGHEDDIENEESDNKPESINTGIGKAA